MSGNVMVQVFMGVTKEGDAFAYSVWEVTDCFERGCSDILNILLR